MSPVFARYVPGLKNWNTPVDFGITHKGKRLLGDNKRWRGIFFGTLVGAITNVVLISIAANLEPSIESKIVAFVAGGLLGFGALAGDAIESYFKRKRGIKPGDSWFPFDQIDYIIGGLILWYPIVQVPLEIVLYIFALYFGLHIVVSYIGFRFGFKDKPI